MKMIWLTDELGQRVYINLDLVVKATPGFGTKNNPQRGPTVLSLSGGLFSLVVKESIHEIYKDTIANQAFEKILKS